MPTFVMSIENLAEIINAALLLPFYFIVMTGREN